MTEPSTHSMLTLCVITYPHAADLDEFEPLERAAEVRLVHARSRSDLHDAECIVLPGSAQVGADLAWLRAQGLDSAVALHAQARRPVLALGGGLQIAGEGLVDPAAIAGNAPGLGLLPLVTLLEAPRAPTAAILRFGDVIGPWAPLCGATVQAEQLHQGRTVQHPGMPKGRAVLADGLGWQNDAGNVLGLAVRGLFRDGAVLRTLFGAA